MQCVFILNLSEWFSSLPCQKLQGSPLTKLWARGDDTGSKVSDFNIFFDYFYSLIQLGGRMNSTTVGLIVSLCVN